MFSILFLFLCALSFENTESVKCYQDGEYGSEDRICQGDFCVISRAQTSFAVSHQKTCITGIKKPSYNCSLHYDDTMICFCDTDYCNIPSIYNTNHTIFPIVECKSIIQQIYTAAACNQCVRIISYLKLDRYELDKFPNQNENIKDLEEEIGCSGRDNSGDFVIDSRIYMPERMLRNFFAKACYNLSFHREQYYVHCRCSEKNCNSPETPNLPYPISPPRIKCYTSGYDVDVHNKKYEYGSNYYKDNYRELLKNDSFVDDESECQGHYCFISIYRMYLLDEDTDIHYKGCISANEQGEQKLSLGYSYLNNIPYYICNTDYCNANKATVLEEANNASHFSDNKGDRSDSIFLVFLMNMIFILIK